MAIYVLFKQSISLSRTVDKCFQQKDALVNKTIMYGMISLLKMSSDTMFVNVFKQFNTYTKVAVDCFEFSLCYISVEKVA